MLKVSLRALLRLIKRDQLAEELSRLIFWTTALVFTFVGMGVLNIAGFQQIWWLALALPLLGAGLGFVWIRARGRQTKALEEKIVDAEIKAEKETEKVRPAWILAQIKLEAYFDRNLQQVNQVSVVAVGVMIVGFCFVLIGVVMSLNNKSEITPVEVVAGGAGVITEFIGATFMVIYRSTMAQANEFMSILERINTVGMTVQVLDSIPETDTKLKNETRARIVELLLRMNARSTTGAEMGRAKSEPRSQH